MRIELLLPLINVPIVGIVDPLAQLGFDAEDALEGFLAAAPSVRSTPDGGRCKVLPLNLRSDAAARLQVPGLGLVGLAVAKGPALALTVPEGFADIVFRTLGERARQIESKYKGHVRFIVPVTPGWERSFVVPVLGMLGIRVAEDPTP